MADARPQIPPLTLRNQTFEARLPVSTAWLLADCMEFRGKQDLWTRQRAELLNALREQATVQSVESSNRIEGVQNRNGAPRDLATECRVHAGGPAATASVNQPSLAKESSVIAQA
jgi:hypothetical protein